MIDLTTHSTRRLDSISLMALPRVVGCRWRSARVNLSVRRLQDECGEELWLRIELAASIREVLIRISSLNIKISASCFTKSICAVQFHGRIPASGSYGVGSERHRAAQDQSQAGTY